MQKNILETLMGAVVLLVAGTFLLFAYKNSQMRVEDGYTVSSRFANASGIALGSDVRIGGIKIGTVTDLMLDPKTYQAVVTMNIAKETQIPRDSSGAIVTSGLLGEKFIQITPGGDDHMIADKGKLQYTQSSVSFEELIGKFMFSGGGVDKNNAATAKPAATAAMPSIATP